MQTSAAKDDILDRALSITPTQFEQLCRILIKRSEPTRELELTPRSGDAGIDVHAVIDRDLFQARLGVQAKRNAEGNTVSSDTMRTFKGSLREADYHVGTFVTTSSFSTPAVKSAEKGYVQLIDGDRLTDIMVRSELGVSREAENEYATDWDFWEIFEIERDDLIRSDAVPQADTVDHMNLVLMAMEAGNSVKPTIHQYMLANSNRSWDDRQADYYAYAGWALGFVHKDTDDAYDGRDRNTWTLSRIGQEYAEYLKRGDTIAAESLLFERIREMEVSKRALRKLRDQGTMSQDELGKLVHENTLPGELDEGLNKETSYRRAKTIGKWMEKLPEVTRRPPKGKPSTQIAGSTYEYIRKNLNDF
jgi:restriction system protein